MKMAIFDNFCPMLTEILPFQFDLDTAAIAGTSLWALSLYLGFSSVKEWIVERLDRWFNFAERSLYISAEEFEKTRQAREAQNALYASIFSIVPFLGVGIFCNWGVETSLGRSWAVSMGILACIASGIYALGRRDSRS
jgi:hypothetical protein